MACNFVHIAGFLSVVLCPSAKLFMCCMGTHYTVIPRKTIIYRCIESLVVMLAAPAVNWSYLNYSVCVAAATGINAIKYINPDVVCSFMGLVQHAASMHG